jgi:hypothetical protein
MLQQRLLQASLGASQQVRESLSSCRAGLTLLRETCIVLSTCMPAAFFLQTWGVVALTGK